jgi:hypothetical protein
MSAGRGETNDARRMSAGRGEINDARRMSAGRGETKDARRISARPGETRGAGPPESECGTSVIAVGRSVHRRWPQDLATVGCKGAHDLLDRRENRLYGWLSGFGHWDAEVAEHLLES